MALSRCDHHFGRSPLGGALQRLSLPPAGAGVATTIAGRGTGCCRACRGRGGGRMVYGTTIHVARALRNAVIDGCSGGPVGVAVRGWRVPIAIMASMVLAAPDKATPRPRAATHTPNRVAHLEE